MNKKMLKRVCRLISVLIISSLVFSLVGCGKSESAPAKSEKTIRLAHWYAESHPQHIAALKFKEIVEKDTNGSLKVQIFPNSQLGTDEQFTEAVKKGTLEMCIAGTAVANNVPEVSWTEFPFLFKSWAHARAALTGEVGQQICDAFNKIGIHCYGISVNGFRAFSSSKPLTTLAEIKTTKMRSPNIKHYMKFFETLGMNPVAIPLSELFTALEQKTADGQENPYTTVLTSKWYEVQPYMLDSKHFFSTNFLVINQKFLDSLTDDEQAILEKAAKEYQKVDWDMSEAADEDAKKKLIELGITVTPCEGELRDELVKAAEAMTPWFYQTYPGSDTIVEKIRNMNI